MGATPEAATDKTKKPEQSHDLLHSLYDEVHDTLKSAGQNLAQAATDIAHGTKIAAEAIATGAVLNPLNGISGTINSFTGAHLPELSFSNQSEVDDAIKEAGHQVKLFGEGVATGAVLNPINGVEQIVNNVAGTHLPPLEFTNQQEVNDSLGGKIGSVVGTAADFILTDGAVSTLSGIGAGSALSLGITGAIEGGVLNPSDASKTGGSFFLDRLENAGIDAASYAAMGGIAGKLEQLTGAGNSIATKALMKASNNILGGTAGGVITAEGQAGKEGHFASLQDLDTTILQNITTGALLGAGTEYGGRALEAASDAFRGAIKPGDDLLARLGRGSSADRAAGNLIDVESDVSPSFAKGILNAVKDLPSSVHKLLGDKNIRIKIGKALTDIRPDLKGVKTSYGAANRTYDNVSGVYDGNNRNAVITEKEVKRGGSKLQKAMESDGTVRHEVGHAVDDALGWFSASTQFQDAWKADVANIPASLRTRLDYYILPNNPGRGAEEAFAEVFAALNGGAAQRSTTALILKYFPEVTKVLKQKLSTLPSN